MAITLKGGGSMNLYARFNNKQVDYLKRTERAWFNVAEGG